MGELIDKMKGKIKEIQGDLTGDRAKHAEGTLDEAKGKVKGAVEDVKERAKQAMDRAEAEKDKRE